MPRIALRIVIFGGTGFIGRHLAAVLRSRGDTVVIANLRGPAPAEQCRGADVVVNLAGAPAAVRWTAAHKAQIRSSRVDLPRVLVEGLGRLPTNQRPARYVSASAVGYYGTSLADVFTEDSGPGSDFLAEVCVGWEREASRAADCGMQVTRVRTGIVLGRDGGMLKPLLPVFRLGLGGPMATGDQWLSWIHLDDQLGIYLMAIDGVDGVLNATAPNPVTNATFARALANALHRPAFMQTPAWVLRLAFGEGSYMVTEGQKVLPARTLHSGFRFRYTEIDAALAQIAG